MNRIHQLQERLGEERLHALVVSRLVNVRYLSGFTGTAGLLVLTPDRATFYTDGRYTDRARAELREGIDLVVDTHAWKRALSDLPAGRVGFESEHVTVHQLDWIREHTGDRVEWVPTRRWVEDLRIRKDPEEWATMREAQRLLEQVLGEVLGLLEPGKTTEWDLAVELEYRLKRAGAEGVSFDPIIASGAQSAIPHATSRRVPIPPNTVLLVDVGARYRGYCSDMTRTFWVGPEPPDPTFKRVYRAVREAQEAALNSLSPGLLARIPDEKAREVLRREQLEEYYTHGLGHGVGLEIHEAPRLSVFAEDHETLEPGMVVTVEPGVYLSGQFGVRIEDMAVLTESGVENLTTFPKELQVL
jgi:Xaa-Pro aminopeptidase